MVESVFDEYLTNGDRLKTEAGVVSLVMVMNYLNSKDEKERIYELRERPDQVRRLLKWMGKADEVGADFDALMWLLDLATVIAQRKVNPAAFYLGRSLVGKEDKAMMVEFADTWNYRAEVLVAAIHLVLATIVNGKSDYWYLRCVNRNVDIKTLCSQLKICGIWPEEGVLGEMVELLRKL